MLRKYFARPGAGWLAALAVYAILQALAYCSLLPLWEGFDEPFHYGYVQDLASGRGLPVLGRAAISDEIWESIKLAPASHIVVRNLPVATSFSDYFSKPDSERRARRAALEALSPELGNVIAHGAPNYEAQHGPLAYSLLAPANRLWSGVPLIWRVWRLRLLCAVLGCAAFLLAIWELGGRMGLAPAWRAAAAFLLLSTQMLWAATAHVANDWLALPLVPLLFLAAERFLARPDLRRTLVFAAALAAGLLAKAYFIAFVPFALALALWAAPRRALVFAGLIAATAGPWYARNLILYGRLLGLQDGMAGIGASSVVEAFISIPWPSALLAAARSTLWTANNSFTSFSAFTLNTMLALLAAGVALYGWRAARRAPKTIDGVLAAGALIYAAAAVYAIALISAAVGRASPSATQWHNVALLPVVFLVCFSGCAAAGRAGRLLARAILALGTYIVAATWFVKLIPLYAGFAASARGSALVELYGSRRGELLDRLGETAILDARIVLAMAAAASVAAAILCVRLCFSLGPLREAPAGSPPAFPG